MLAERLFRDPGGGPSNSVLVVGWTVDLDLESVFRQLARPSHTVPTGSPLLRGEDPTKSWTAVLTRDQIRDVAEIVEAFGLDRFYA